MLRMHRRQCLAGRWPLTGLLRALVLHVYL